MCVASRFPLLSSEASRAAAPAAPNCAGGASLPPRVRLFCNSIKLLRARASYSAPRGMHPPCQSDLPAPLQVRPRRRLQEGEARGRPKKGVPAVRATPPRRPPAFCSLLQATQLARRTCSPPSLGSLAHCPDDTAPHDTARRGVDIVYESVGGQLFDDAVSNVAPNGRVIIIGAKRTSAAAHPLTFFLSGPLAESSTRPMRRAARAPLRRDDRVLPHGLRRQLVPVPLRGSAAAPLSLLPPLPQPARRPPPLTAAARTMPPHAEPPGAAPVEERLPLRVLPPAPRAPLPPPPRAARRAVPQRAARGAR